MVNKLCIIVFYLSVISLREDGIATAANMESWDEQKAYLERYNYLGDEMSDMIAAITQEKNKTKAAIKAFQKMAALNQTGDMNKETMSMMRAPRCGVKDILSAGDVAKRRKRYAAEGSMWQKDVVTYNFVGKLTNDLPEATIRREMKGAFDIWSNAAPALKFIESSKADIEISFARRNHDDGNPFDGPGGTLAHAYFPQYGGDIHFDDEETWSSQSHRGTNFQQVAIHELGHSLGLQHSDHKDAIMFAFYRGYIQDIKLHADDISGIQYIYKSKQRLSDKKWCEDSSIDAIVATNSATIVFKGDEYAELDLNGIVPGYPKPISAGWQNLRGKVDAAIYWTDAIPNYPGGESPSIYIFKGDLVYRYSTNSVPATLFHGYPKKISEEFRGVPDNVDTAFVWSGNGKLYFMKGSSYYRYTRGRGLDYGYPRRLSVWKGIPNKVDAAVNYVSNSRTYFFSGNYYYRFNDVHFQVDSGYPLATGDVWFGCNKANLHAMMEEEEDGMHHFMEMSAMLTIPSKLSVFVLTSVVLLSNLI